MSNAPASVRADSLIGGRYRLMQVIGEGGMARVWRAEDTVLRRDVALKFLLPRGGDDSDRIARFTREARLGASVRHPNVVGILDFGTLDTGEEFPTPYMAMELLSGESLEQRLVRSPPLSLEELITIAIGVLDGLAAVHRAGIVHRDLKPDNVFLCLDETGEVRPKLLDFGVSRATDPASGRRSVLTTSDGRLVGTPEYMPPEQARGRKDIDLRVDLYALGVILYEGITGDLPYWAEGVGDLIISIVRAEAPRVFDCRPEAGKPLSDVVAKAMAPERDDRYASASEMKAALMDAAEESLGFSARASLIVQVPARHVMPAAVAIPHVDSVHSTYPPPPEDGAFRTWPPSGTHRVVGSDSPTLTGSSPALPAVLEEQLRRASEPEPAVSSQAPASASRAPWLIAAAAVLSLVGVGAFSVLGGALDAEEPAPERTAAAAPSTREAPTALPVGPAADEAASPALPEEPPPAPPASAHLTLRSLPRGARVTIDDVEVAAPDGTLELPADGAEHTVAVWRGGRRWSDAFLAEGQIERTVRLEAAGTTAPAAPGPAAAPATAAPATAAPATAAPATTEAPEPASPGPARSRAGVFTDLDY